MDERGLKVSSGELSEILGGEYETSEIVELVHEFLEWPPPLPPTASRDAGELTHLGVRMTKGQRDLLERAAEIISGQSGDAAERAIASLVDAFAKQDKK